MKVKDLIIRVNGEVLSADQIKKLSIDGIMFEVEYAEKNKQDGISKFSKIRCRSNDVEILCSRMASESYIDVLGNKTETVYCTFMGGCQNDTGRT